jgi:hypothetical protein
MNNNSNDAGGYSRVHVQLFDRYGPELGPIPIAVYIYLVRCADKDGYCCPDYKKMAYHCGGISRKSAEQAIAKLIKLGLIEKGHGSPDADKYKIRLEAFSDE